ncbi:hypothetical protein HNQ91_001172 [Filimonas zeae]|uniref:Uncharacterized protein n=1 Tax=Filimonas zeae TaxID=1737353 RepID=A0A917MUX1_9BACT|nr:hypothetical protein [Filimonas zeae]MDR6338150.1 hypothetical protein [Filimonas zeae]GGH61968.1 hypothetical protein GCM10011379_11460 [Filimonas zeae]
MVTFHALEQIILIAFLAGIFGTLIYIAWLLRKLALGQYSNHLDKGHFDFRNKPNYMVFPENLFYKALYRIENEYRLRFTVEASNFLLLPIREYYLEVDHINAVNWQQSLYLLGRELYNRRDEYDYKRLAEGFYSVTAVDVMNAIRLNWCSIPPFCKPPRSNDRY